MQAALPPDASLGDILTQFATSIDMLGWVGLVFLFELETHTIPDEKWTVWLAGIIRGLRVACYLFIAQGAYGYTVETLEYYDLHPVEGVTDICQLADQGESKQISVFEYEEITSENCASLSDESEFFTVANEVAILDWPILDHVRFQEWVNIVNAYVWLIVVWLIEVEVYMQNRDRFGSKTLNRVRVAKTLFYIVLIGVMLIWFFTGYYLYSWDAFLWIFGFWAIELNLAEWEMERKEELAHAV